MFSVMYTGMNLLPLWTASVCPTNSGEIVEARAHVLMTRFSPRAFIAWIFSRSRASMYGPFLIDRAMGLPSLLPFPVRYDVALPRRRPRTMYLFDSLFRRRVFLPSGLPHGDTGGRPPDVRPSPPPSGWSIGFIATPRTFGRRPRQRFAPAFPTLRSSWSRFPTCPIVARHSLRTIRTSLDGSRKVT